METMGMTDKQFNGFLRFVIGDLEKAVEEKNVEEKDKALKEIIEKLQTTIED